MSKGRVSTTRAKSETQSREETIKLLAASGLKNDAIWAAMEQEYPQIIKDAASRKRVAGKAIPFDDTERERVGWAIRSVKGLLRKDDENFDGLIASNVTVGSIADTEFKNRPRWGCGIAALDYIYGETKYRHPEDAPDSNYLIGVDPITKQKVKTWMSGSWRQGDPLCIHEGKVIPVRDSAGNMLEEINKQQRIEQGLPFGYFGFWGGQPGVGKSRTAIGLTHSVNQMGHLVHYYNGEADASDFRSWCGPKVNRNLFRVWHSDCELIPVSQIISNTMTEKPRLVIIDSTQMIAEWNKGIAAQKRCLAQLRVLKSDPAAGNPHILLISQLNKKMELAGAKILEHLVDYSIKVFRREGYKNQFFMESVKMRGAECPRGGLFRHTDEGVRCESTELAKGTSVFDLFQPTSNPTLAKGVSNPDGYNTRRRTES